MEGLLPSAGARRLGRFTCLTPIVASVPSKELQFVPTQKDLVARVDFYISVFDERGRMWVIQYLQYPTPAGLKPISVDNYLRTKYDCVPEPPPHLRDVHLHRVGRARGRRLPEELDQPLDRDHPPRVERQGGDESALLPGRDRDRAAVLSDFDRPQEPHLHGGDDDTRGSG